MESTAEVYSSENFSSNCYQGIYVVEILSYKIYIYFLTFLLLYSLQLINMQLNSNNLKYISGYEGAFTNKPYRYGIRASVVN